MSACVESSFTWDGFSLQNWARAEYQNHASNSMMVDKSIHVMPGLFVGSMVYGMPPFVGNGQQSGYITAGSPTKDYMAQYALCY